MSCQDLFAGYFDKAGDTEAVETLRSEFKDWRRPQGMPARKSSSALLTCSRVILHNNHDTGK